MKRSGWVLLLCLASLSGTVEFGSSRIVAAAAPPPAAIALTRLTTLNGNVWPGDFNGDGKTDLVASGTDGSNRNVLVIALGDGTGSFAAPISSSFAGGVFAVGDFNNDRKLDVVGVGNDGTTVSVIAGNGDGTLGAAHTVADMGTAVIFVGTADLDGDGNRDLVVGIDGQTTVEIFPGHGDFTFGPPISLTTNPLPGDAIIADFNGDGRKDLAVTNRYFPHSVAVFLNQGGFTFTASDIALDRSATDVTAGDVNGDGKLDLLVSTAAPEDIGYFTEGYVNVLLGNGDGTFQAPVVYTVPPGPWQIVVGDFNRDGLLDVATANRSTIVVDDCGGAYKTWDTVSILAGRGDGTFDAPSSFSLGDQSDLIDDRFRESVTSLNTSDLNGDHQTDLIASQGAILINRAATANRAPTVSAGQGGTFNGSASEVFLSAVASDPDNDMLTYSWTASDGRSILSVPQTCVDLDPGTYTFTVTVDDGHGHTASSSVTYTVRTQVYPTVTVTAPKAGDTVPGGKPLTITWTASSDTPITRIDVSAGTTVGNQGIITSICTNLPGTATSCTWNDPGPATDNARISVSAIDADGDEDFGSTGQFTISGSSSISPLPGGWYHADIGDVGAAGSASKGGVQFDGDQYTVTGSGADIWGTADAFHYAWRSFTGDFEITTRVNSVQAVDPWTKGGIMVRETATDPSSRHASIFITPGKGVAYQRRLTTGGSSVNTSRPSLTAPIWLRMTRVGNLITAYYRRNPNDDWSAIGSDTMSGLPTTIDAGLAVTSHHDDVLATTQFAGTWSGVMPTWTNTTIGAATGNATSNGTTVSVVAKGADIWDTADAFEYRWVQVSGNATITVRVDSVSNANAWSKAGLMFRESLAPDSKQVDAIVSASKGVTMQYRAAASGTSASAAIVGGTAPLWLRLQRTVNFSASTDAFTSWYSNDGVNWIALGNVTGVNMSATGDVYAGVAVTSHNTAASTTSTVDSVRVQ